MRIAIIVLGVLLIGAGALIAFGKLSYPDQTEEVKVGAFSATLTQQRPIPVWLGAVTVLTGLAIVLLGTKYRR